MAKFNTTTKGADKTVNHEGVVAYRMNAKTELYSAVVTTMMEPKFYESQEGLTERIRNLVAQVAEKDPEFVAKLAIYAREKMYLRSIPLVLGVELARVHSGDALVSKVLRRVIRRPDEITETLSYYSEANNRKGNKKLGKISNQVRLGVAGAFSKFDEYQFAKYNRQGAVKLKDALFLTHPNAETPDQEALFKKIAEDTLETPDTWEVELSTGEDKKTSWERLVLEDKLGYMAMLRNLRNILQAGVSEDHIQKVCDYISNPEAVRKSKQLPFRFYSAARELETVSTPHTSWVLRALDSAMTTSAFNIPGFSPEETIYVATDASGSMYSPVSGRSKIQMVDIGLVLTSMLSAVTNKMYGAVFGTNLKHVNLLSTNVLGNLDRVRDTASNVGYGTNGYKIIDDMLKRNLRVDKVVIFTDCQLYESGSRGMWFLDEGPTRTFRELWSEYRKTINPDAKLYMFDLNGYGTTPVSVKDGSAYLISGWSERIFDMLEAYENGMTAVDEIEKIEI